eukprot:353632-Chlamydomonas_euryale.AAC.8
MSTKAARMAGTGTPPTGGVGGGRWGVAECRALGRRDCVCAVARVQVRSAGGGCGEATCDGSWELLQRVLQRRRRGRRKECAGERRGGRRGRRKKKTLAVYSNEERRAGQEGVHNKALRRAARQALSTQTTVAGRVGHGRKECHWNSSHIGRIQPWCSMWMR